MSDDIADQLRHEGYIEAIKLKKAQLDTEHQIKLLEISRNHLYGEEIESSLEKGYIGEPTPTQFQEAHKKWRETWWEKWSN